MRLKEPGAEDWGKNHTAAASQYAQQTRADHPADLKRKELEKRENKKSAD